MKVGLYMEHYLFIEIDGDTYRIVRSEGKILSYNIMRIGRWKLGRLRDKYLTIEDPLCNQLINYCEDYLISNGYLPKENKNE